MPRFVYIIFWRRKLASDTPVRVWQNAYVCYVQQTISANKTSELHATHRWYKNM